MEFYTKLSKCRHTNVYEWAENAQNAKSSDLWTLTLSELLFYSSFFTLSSL